MSDDPRTGSRLAIAWLLAALALSVASHVGAYQNKEFFKRTAYELIDDLRECRGMEARAAVARGPR